MIQSDWMETWGRIKKRYPKWQPTDVETEDWCIALRGYKKEMVEDIARWVRQQYTSQIPTIKWFIVEIEKRIKESKAILSEQNQISPDEEWEAHEVEKEKALQQLENTDIDKLRDACRYAINKYGNIISKPESGNPRDWKPTLRATVWKYLYG